MESKKDFSIEYTNEINTNIFTEKLSFDNFILNNQDEFISQMPTDKNLFDEIK